MQDGGAGLTEDQIAWLQRNRRMSGASSSADLGNSGAGSSGAAPAAHLDADGGSGTKPLVQAPAAPPAAAPAPDTAPSCWITVTNDTKSVLKLAHQGHDAGDFESFPTSTVQPGAATSFVSVQTLQAKSGAQGCKGFVEWTIEPAGGQSSPATTWRVMWNNPIGEKNTASATITPSGSGFTSLEQIGEGDAHVPVVFTLSGSGGGAAAPAPVREVEITIQNATDGTLLLTDEWLDRMSTDSLIPATITAGQSATIHGAVEDYTSNALNYAVVPAGVTQAPPHAPAWEVQWVIQPDGKFVAPDNQAEGLTAEATTDGVRKFAFKLSGKLPAATQPQRTGVTINNDTDRMLRLISAKSDAGRFDPAPPNEIAAGADVALAAIDVGSGTVVYQVEAQAGTTDKPEQPSSWTLSWKQRVGQPVQADADLDPPVKGWNSAAAGGKASIAFMLTGAPAGGEAPKREPGPQSPPSPQPRPQTQYQRTSVTLSNQSNMMLRLVHNDRTTARWDPMPPMEIKPGASATTATFTTGETDADLMYLIAPSGGEGPKSEPMWVVRWKAIPGHPPMVWNLITPGLPGIFTDFGIGEDAVTFELSGQWSAESQERKTSVSITNRTRAVLRLRSSEASAARFDPPPPKEIAPGATVLFATWAKNDSSQKLVYAVAPAEGEAKEKASDWILTWHTRPGEDPYLEASGVEGASSSADVVGHESVAFAIDAFDDQKK